MAIFDDDKEGRGSARPVVPAGASSQSAPEKSSQMLRGPGGHFGLF